ncbi:MAG TPA: CRISPR-associated endonuclease Cas1 [Bryobacteraceae bacterium]|nr:CRISPR-associated endonuclease Cas1 [Bryobacteraceae bacterium]
MFSLDELHGAFERVRENEGCAGVDGVTVQKFAVNFEKRIERLRQAVMERTYRPLPLLEIVVRKAPDSEKTRRLLVPPVVDRILQTAAARQLSHSFEEEFLDSSFAYRPGRGVDSAVARVLQLRDRGYVWVLDADVVAYFDEVDHSSLYEILARERMEEWLRDLVNAWIAAEIWDGVRIRRLRKGIPQGSPLSPLLANLFLHDLDAELSRGDHHIVRYADDFVVLCAGEPEAREALRISSEWLARRKLTLHPEKTRLTQFKEGFRFLGVRFVEDEALIPWKHRRPQGQVVRMAKPMPATLLRRYVHPKPKSAMRLAMEASGVAAGRVEAPPAPGRRVGVAFLYLTQQGAVLRKSGDRFLVEKESRVLLDLPYHKLEAVLVFGNVQVTTQALGELMEKAIPVSFLTRQGRFRGSVNTPAGRDIPLRMAQFKSCSDGGRCAALSSAVISAKIRNSIEALAAYEARSGVIDHALGERLEQARQAPALEALLGVEGAAAREYFTTLMGFNRSEFVWPGRLKYPARDPLNALLSLGYTLLMAETTGLLEAHGLDPYLGFLHQADYGRVSLALDLIEPFRAPVADRFVLTLVNRRVVQAKDFAGPAKDGAGTRPVYLTPEALARFLRQWEEWMTAQPPSREGAPAAKPFRRELRRQIEVLVRHWRGECEWEPWTWDHRQSPEEEACDSLSVTT